MKSHINFSDTTRTNNTSTNTSKKNLPGIWLGIDLGTTNTTCAFYSPSRHVSKLIRFSPSYASIQKRNDKFGRILPSAVYYEDGVVNSIGKGALLMKNHDDDTQEPQDQNDNYDGKHVEEEVGSKSNGFLLTSVKRIWGMDTVQIKDEMNNDSSFLESCPFQTTWVNGELKICINNDDNHNESGDENKTSIVPIEVAEILLRTIREEANNYFMRERRRKKHYPLGFQSEQSEEKVTNDSHYNIRHCIITIPAHFSRKQRDKIIQAAKNAGFDGYINTLVESTAAAMAYGLFVSPTKLVQEPSKDGVNDTNNVRKHEGRKILVCDMGGGTTDITIAEMVPSNNDKDSNEKNEPSFQVLATAGERRLGGDDMDEALAQFIVKDKIKKSHDEIIVVQSKKKEWNKLLMICRVAKESLCGDGKDASPEAETIIKYCDEHQIVITQEEFSKTIQHLVDRVAVLVDKSLHSCKCTYESIDEVILVGGATRTPAIRTMLQSKFQKNELCYSIDADAAVVQGAAIQCAISSGLVPKHELRNALMLDALPHTIGVLVSTGDEDEVYIPILVSGMALPAMGYASFELADMRQKGVTIVAVEDVGEDLPLERVGEFTFLLHRMSEEELLSLDNGKRMVNVGMTVDVDARFIVSIFDSNDPDDLKKKERYLEWKQRQEKNDQLKVHVLGSMDTNLEKKSKHFALEEVLLLICSLLLFGLYIAVRLLFNEPGREGAKII